MKIKENAKAVFGWFIRISIIFVLLVSTSCLTVSGLNDILPGNNQKLDNQTIIKGLKEALTIGTQNAVDIVSDYNGYWGNKEIKILIPSDLRDWEKKLRQLGFGSQIDDFVEEMNRAAEAAAKDVVDIFHDAIMEMTFNDARKILQGRDNEATLYFESKTRGKLYDRFYPVISSVMNRLGVTKIYNILKDAYNSIPFIQKIDFEINVYVTNEALDGLFHMLAKEEKEIRRNPAARVTELLRKVFG